MLSWSCKIYQQFIKEFSKIARPMRSLSEQEARFDFDKMCLKYFGMLKGNLIEAPILVASNWELPFELMYDAIDVELCAVLGQRKYKVFHLINYASKTLDSLQANYTVIEKEMLALVFTFFKFILNLVGTKMIAFTDHVSSRYLFNNKGAKPRVIRWISLLQEFILNIKDRKDTENQIANHLYKLEDFSHVHEGEQIWEEFLDEQWIH